MRPSSFTVAYSGPARSLESEVHVGPPVEDQGSVEAKEALSRAKLYAAIWDTGATSCVVSKKVVDECGLIPVGFAQVHYANGVSVSPVYRVSLFLPNGLSFAAMHVTRGEPHGCDVLIGMDVIRSGDFAVSRHPTGTMFSFRVPSGGPIDFVRRQGLPPPTQKVGRNSPCPCGSGRKYKQCHGRGA